MGRSLAQRTIDKLNLNMHADELQAEVKATALTDTVLINVTVLDPSPIRARDIANTLSDEFVVMAAGLEAPYLGAKPNARVVVQERADIPDAPVGRKTASHLIMALTLGALLGVVIAIVRDRLDDTVRSAQAIEKAAGVGLIADIPFDAQRLTEPLISFESDRSPIAEAFRELRINLQFLEVRDGTRVLLMTSSASEEGTTTTAINLSLALAQAGFNVVIVDGDLRRPRIASCFDLVGEIGFSTVLTDGAALQEALQETRFPRLTALTSGSIPTSPTELLESRAARDVLNELGTQFDYVIVDSPPLPVVDAVILAMSCTGVLMIAQFGKTKRKQLARAIDTLRRGREPVIGTILTMTPAKRRKSADGRYYGTDHDVQVQAGRWRRGWRKK